MIRKTQFTMGGDPEFFFNKGDQIIGSEKVLPAKGLKPSNAGAYVKPYVVRDGIQVELNPPAAQNVGALAVNLKNAFTLINETLKTLPGVKCDFTGTIDVTPEEFASLDPTSRILGCKPSKNIYGHRPILVDGETYLTRSAGGHYHFGLGYTGNYEVNLHNKRVDLIALCDLLVGNTMTLIDRDPRAAERRENYGRAGEYREPGYGVEYRTLSNSWLKNYTLMDLAFGLGEIAVGVLAQDKLVDELVEIVNIDLFADAINTSNRELALANFNTIRPFLVKHLPKGEFILDADNIDRLLAFSEGVEKKGLENFFSQEPMAHWVEGKFEGIRSFLQRLY